MRLSKHLTNKLLVCAIIWLLAFVSIASLVQSVNAYSSDVTEITSLPLTITESGDYVLTGNLTVDSANAITIQADNVTIHGEGFSINVEDEAYCGIYAQGYSNIGIYNLSIVGGDDAFHFENCNSTAFQSCHSTNAANDGFKIIDSWNSSLIYCYATECNDCGYQFFESDHFQIDSCIATYANESGMVTDACTDFEISSCLIQNNGNGSKGVCGLDIWDSSDASIYNCTFDSNFEQAGLMVLNSQFIYVDYCTFTNQTLIGAIAQTSHNCEFYGNTFETSGSCGLAIAACDIQVSNNKFYNNGIDMDNYYGMNCGLTVTFTNCTVSDNLFENNTNAIYWFMTPDIGDLVDYSDIVTTLEVEENVFQNNDNTFLFDYEFPTSYSNQSFIFTNNLVNDTAYVNPAGLQMAVENVPINGTVFSFNGTVQCAHKIFGVGPFIGGNYWAHPNGAGPSQTGIDANGDGFIDTPLELLGNATVGAAYDYHPYSDIFDPNQWVNITLPAVIYSPGHYRIMNSFNGSYGGLTVIADNVVVDGQNNDIQATGYGDYPSLTIIGNHITLENLTVQKSLAGIYISATNSTIRNVNISTCLFGGLMVNSTNVTFENSSVDGGMMVGLLIEASENVTISNCSILNTMGILYSTTGGIWATDSNNFTVENTVINGTLYTNGFYASQCSNFQLKNCSLTNNYAAGFKGMDDVNFTVTNCILNSNDWGSSINTCYNVIFRNCLFSNNSQALYAGLSNVTIVGNTVSYSDKEGVAYQGGVESANSNLTAVSNTFDNNFDAFLWTTTLPINTTTVVHNNIFRNNNYTFFINNQLPNTVAPQKLLFFNNLVNDSAYVDPTCLTATYSGNYLPFNASAFNFNATLQTGGRIYGAGSRIGGNFWVYPNGTGPSQTGADANRDGFLDAAFELFGNAEVGTVFDYLPLSASYTSSLSFTAGAGQSVSPNQMSDVITVTRTDYFGSVSGITVKLASSSIAGTFYSDAAGTKQVTSITMAPNQTTASFYYKDSIQGSPVITAMGQDANQAQTTFTIKYASSASSSESTTTTSTSPTVTPTPTPTATPTPTPTPQTIQATKDDNTKATITISGGNIAASQFSNITLTANLADSKTILAFTITGEVGTEGFCNLTIAKSEIPYGTTPIIYIDGTPAANQGYTEDANNYYIWYTTHFSTHQISVQFNGLQNAPSETPSWLYIAVIVAVVAAIAGALVVIRKRKH